MAESPYPARNAMSPAQHGTAMALCCMLLLSCQTTPTPADEYSGEVLLHETALARQAWQQELALAERIAQLRSDDKKGRGIRREWIGPAGLKDRLTPEESHYFERIWAVYLGGTSVTDADVRALAGLTDLREIYLHSTTVTDAALTRMASLRKLRVLHLLHTQVSDAGTEALSHLTSLRHLYLQETHVTKAARIRLQSKLPNTEIVWWK